LFYNYGLRRQADGGGSFVYDYVLYCDESLKMVVILTVMMASHTVKRLAIYPSPAGTPLTKLSLAGNNLIIPGQRPGSLVSDIPAGDGKIANLFLQCKYHSAAIYIVRRSSYIHCKKRLAIFPFPAKTALTKLSQAGNNLIFPV
jgi:hypothetical protein